MGRIAALLVVALLLLISGCNGDDDENETTAVSTPTETETTATETVPSETEAETEAENETEPEVETEPEIETETLPEEQPGGAGDEEAARSLALFTAENGRVRPRLVRVPSFISIRVELRAGDGNTYGLTIGGKTIAVGERVSSMSVTLDGLRPGDAYVGTLEGAEGRVRIAATAEPGP